MSSQEIPSIPLSEDERLTLHVFAWLLLRMGLTERAGRFYAVLAETDGDDRRALAGLAAVELTRPGGKPANALKYLDAALAPGLVKTHDAALHLLRAQALWRAGRAEEARNAVESYRHLTGNEG